MKKINYSLKALVTAGLLFSAGLNHAQNFTWVKGSNQQDQPGTYGTLNTPAATNNPGGRDGAVTWKDAAGNLWLFGGEGYDVANSFDLLNDLWKYDITTNNWIWMSGDNTSGMNGVYGTLGTAASTNKPGGRLYSASWADNSGNLWLMGGYGYDGASNVDLLNDLWKYNIASNQWTWIKGSNTINQPATYGSITVAASANKPGARLAAKSWTDASGNFWLFGGYGNDATTNQSVLNDLWRYNPTTNQWTWMNGSNTTDMNGVYGTIGVPAAINTPGARLLSSATSDAAGNLWLMGGLGVDATLLSSGDLNDLWKYNPTTNMWTWMSGNNSVDMNGVYGTIGVAAPTNIPGSRDSHNMWFDNNGNFWVFGGSGFDATASSSDYINDLWKYNITTSQWTWMKGSSTQASAGSYGTIGVAAASNMPGARGSANNWTDNSGTLWLFGGYGYDASATGNYNDLWKLNFCPAATVVIAPSSASVCPSTSTSLQASGAVGSFSWSTGQVGSNIVVTPTATTNYSVVVSTTTGCDYSASFSQSVFPTTVVNASSTKQTICLGQSAILTGSGAGTYSWLPQAVTGTTVQVTPSVTATYTLIGKDVNGCVGTATFVQNVSNCTGIDQAQDFPAISLFPNPSKGQLNIVGTELLNGAGLTIYNSAGQIVLHLQLNEGTNKFDTNLSSGIYLYQITNGSTVLNSGKLMIE